MNVSASGKASARNDRHPTDRLSIQTVAPGGIPSTTACPVKRRDGSAAGTGRHRDGGSPRGAMTSSRRGVWPGATRTVHGLPIPPEHKDEPPSHRPKRRGRPPLRRGYRQSRLFPSIPMAATRSRWRGKDLRGLDANRDRQVSAKAGRPQASGHSRSEPRTQARHRRYRERRVRPHHDDRRGPSFDAAPWHHAANAIRMRVPSGPCSSKTRTRPRGPRWNAHAQAHRARRRRRTGTPGGP